MIAIKNNEDLSNQKIGLLTVVRLDDDKNAKTAPDQVNHRYWICKCECGNTTSVRQDKLIYGKTKSCGCFRKDGWTKDQDAQLINCYINDVKIADIASRIGRSISAVKNRIVALKLSSIHHRKHGRVDPNDIIGQKFGKLTVKGVLISESGTNAGETLYNCVCDCGEKDVIVHRKYLLNGSVKSCGCLRKENLSTIAKKEPLECINHENDYYECILGDGSSFFFDYEDYDIVYKLRWAKNTDGYIFARTNNDTIYLHRLIMSKYYDIDNLQIDHIRGKETRNDNRKANLRVVTISQNRMNVGIKKNNKSGVTGVSWSNYYNVWVTRITKDGKIYCLGNFTNFEDAVSARRKAEKKYFGEYSYSNSQSDYVD